MKRTLIAYGMLVISSSAFAGEIGLAVLHGIRVGAGSNGASHCTKKTGSQEVFCFETEGEYNTFLLKHKKEVAQIWQELQADAVACRERVAEKRNACRPPLQEVVNTIDCTIPDEQCCIAQDVCPLEDELIESYIDRVKSVMFSAERDEPRQLLRTQDLLQDTFWETPWHIKRYLLAMNMDVGLIQPDETLPIVGLTSLDLAVAQKDLGFILYAWTKGARKTENTRSQDYIRHAMMASSDERSVKILKEICDLRPYSNEWEKTDWAKDLSPELVWKKAPSLLKVNTHQRLSGNEWESRGRKYNRDNFPSSTPGEIALQEFAERAGYFRLTNDGCMVM